MPFFEVGPKTYLGRSELLNLAIAARDASLKYEVSVIFTSPLLDIEFLHREVPEVWIFAQSMDPDEAGRSTGATIAEAVQAVGADGVLLNHAERPLGREALVKSITRSREVGLMSLVCASTLANAIELAYLRPNMILIEPPELIGTMNGARRPNVGKINEAIRRVDSRILVMHSGGISSPKDVFALIAEGADGTGSTSAILESGSPEQTAVEMIRSVREAWDERQKLSME